MLFRSFASQQERRAFGGSSFLELQYCKLHYGTPLRKIISVMRIEHWKDDSLYVYIDDLELFFSEYSGVFVNGTYNNLKNGVVDLHGINYYSPSQIETIVERICNNRPVESDVLLEWLKDAEETNGFYILGI